MNSVPSTTEQDIDSEEDEQSWTDFLLPLALLAIAVVPFTPFWDQFTDPDNQRRRFDRIASFLDSVGPVPVSLTFAVLGGVLLTYEIVKRRKNGSEAPEGAEV